VDGDGGRAQRDRVLVWGGGRILALLAPDEAAARGIAWRDFPDGCLLPALIDGHVHLALPGDAQGELRRAPLGADAAEAARRIDRHLAAQRAAGVAVVRDGGDRGGVVLQRSERGGLEGATRVRAPGPAFFRQGRYGGFIGEALPAGGSLAAAIAARLAPGCAPRPDHLKILNSGINSLKHYGHQTPPQFAAGELQAAVAAAGRLALGCMVHANGREPVAGALEAGCRSIEHGYFMGPENLARMAERGVFWVPTVAPMARLAETMPPGGAEAATARRTLEDQLEQIALARRLGVAIVAGSDAGGSGVTHGRALHWELGWLMAAGFGPEAAVRCAGGEAARLLDLPDLGRLAPGCRASFLAVPGAPEDLPRGLERIALVVLDGRVVAQRAAGCGAAPPG
jgi:imidazolonepropionase-like amidohydrolase